jgi:hypothetical protein
MLGRKAEPSAYGYSRLAVSPNSAGLTPELPFSVDWEGTSFMFQIIPAIGTLLALAAFFFAVYFRTVQKYAKIGTESVRELGEMPARSRLDATKVLVNVFDLDVKALSPDQQFQLAQKTFEKRESESRRNFILLISGGVILLLFAAGYSVAKLDGASMVRTALALDEGSATSALNGSGFYQISDMRLVDTLANRAVVDRSIDDPFERADKFRVRLARQPIILALRERAQQDKAPFELTGDILDVSVPTRPDQPPRFKVYVRRNSPLAGRIVTIRAKGRDQYLRLHAQGAIDSDGSTDVQLNYEQFTEVFGDKPRDLRKALTTPSSAQSVFDPTCPKYEGFRITTCDLEAKIELAAIPS